MRASPFPGMDPYLEAPHLFPGLHDSLLTYLKDDIQGALPEAYYADLQDRVFLGEADRWVVPDVRVTERSVGPDIPGVPGTIRAAEGATPALLVAAEVEVREPFVEIRDVRSGNRVVTVIELLSPWNKRAGSDGERLYKEKQRELLRSEVNLVEIDLLRAGKDVALISRDRLPPGAPRDYLVVTRRVTRPIQREVYAFGFRDPLPRVAVPLRDPDPDIVVDLQALFARAYANGAYWKRIDYAAGPEPPLSPDDGAWARDRLASLRAERGPRMA